ncbi:hypothetical protein BNJ_00161 [Kaumoebavirus]|uniref:hypothetical protein n=1 Tax=Kaumoebavirus TaxID=1859492 RepID=UPI0009C23948|nr:hypothetical protein BNJ_00161 [Kaumoebavirus]ARA71993.1 hypothetical protein BNJ_00161 [Kaumoebavirus]
MEITKKYCEEVSKGKVEELELEIRSSLEKDRFAELLGKISKDGKEGSLELSINFLGKPAGEKKSRTSLVRQLIFVGAEKKEEKLYIKVPLIEPYVSSTPSYKIALNREKPTSEKLGDDVEFVRVRARWIISGATAHTHFTLTQNYPVQSIPNLKSFKDRLFGKLTTYKSFIHSLESDEDGWNAYEFECEILPPKECEPINILGGINVVLQTIFDGATNFQYQEAITELAAIVYDDESKIRRFKSGAAGLKGLGKSVISVTKTNWNNVWNDLKSYYVAEKIDGERTVVLIEGETAKFISSELQVVKIPSSKKFVLEGEQTENRFYVYDVWVWNDENVLDRPFAERIARVDSDDAADIFKRLKITGKPFKPVIDGETIKDFWEASVAGKFSKDEEKDGLIFVKNAPYRAMQTYKWKPAELLTIDFVAKKPPQRVLGVAPFVNKAGHTLYWLFCSITREQYMRKGLSFPADYDILFPNMRRAEYFPIQFSPPDAPLAYLFYSKDSSLDGKVVEMGWNEKDGWKLHRVREDREVEVKRGTWFGNDFVKVAEPNWDSLHDPVTIEWLINPEFGYFNKEKSEAYAAQTAYNSFVKTRNIHNYLRMLRQSAGYKQRPFHNYVIDLAAGKGQDLFRLEQAEVKEALFVDIDTQALNELKRRVQTSEKPMRMKVWTKAADLTEKASKNLEELRTFNIPEEGADLIICNFAIHYLVGNPTNIVELVSGLLRPGGVFVFSCFDGQRLGELLDENKGTIVWGDGDVVDKYKISKTTTGKIAVKLPFSDEPYEEMLVDIDQLVGYFEKAGFQKELRRNFGYLLPLYEGQQRAKKLSEVDKKYVDLYSYAALYKK